MPSPAAERQVLLAPDAVARTASTFAPDAEARWMLRQPRDVRRSFVEEVFGRPDEERLQQIWMLRQPRELRASFVDAVLRKKSPPPLDEIWMLSQDDAVCASYVREVLLAGEAGYAAGGS
jgi:hypothetical protein